MATTYIDPVAQTFFIDEGSYPKGLFVHSVDLIFRKTDTLTNQPFTVQIRPTVNGYPHSSIYYPFAETTRDWDRINTVTGEGSDVPNLDNANHYTRFTFPAPVYLLPGEHALILFTNSDEYEVFISEIGGERLDGSERRIDKQPYSGSLFKSQNGTIYTAFQDLDLMFRLNICQFETNTNYALRVKNEAPTSNIEYDLLKLSTTDLSFKDTSISYSFRSMSNASRTLDSDYNDIVVNRDLFLDERKVVEANSNNSFLINASLITEDANVSPVIDTERLNLITVKYIIDNCGLKNENFSIVNPGTGYTANAVVTLTSGAGTDATVVAVANTTTGQIERIEVTNPGYGYVDTLSAAVAAPSVPSGNTTAVISVESETNNSGGPALVRYITRQVTLSDGFDANMLRVYLTAYLPPQAEIDVYYKVLADEDPANFTDRPYVRMKNVQFGNESLVNTTKSKTETDYFEYLFIPTTTDTSYVGTNDILYENFKSFAIKIVMRTSDPVYSPILQDMRAIALAP